jgi:hypothetical protein
MSHQLKRLMAGRGRERTVAVLPQQSGKLLPDMGKTVNDQYLHGRPSTSTSSSLNS